MIGALGKRLCFRVAFIDTPLCHDKKDAKKTTK